MVDVTKSGCCIVEYSVSELHIRTGCQCLCKSRKVKSSENDARGSDIQKSIYHSLDIGKSSDKFKDSHVSFTVRTRYLLSSLTFAIG